MKVLSDAQVDSLLSREALIDSLEKAFQSEIAVPQRMHLNVPQHGGDPNTMLVMPAWGKMVGVKVVTVAPDNARMNEPTIHGTYQLIDKKTGVPELVMDSRTLTTRRTACASAVASKLLSREDSSVLLMIGTGALAPEMIRAHCAVRPIKRVIVYARNEEKTKKFIATLDDLEATVELAENLEEAVAEADIISCATTAKEPVLFGKWLKEGQHIDLVGAYRPEMREVDDEAIERSALFVETMQGIRESGEIAIPLNNGLISESAIRGDLFALCNREVPARLSRDQITLYKSVGFALEDLCAAELVWQSLEKQQDGGE
jgi:alanine dehydrogenase